MSHRHANIKVISDGTIPGTRVVFINEEGIEKSVIGVTEINYGLAMDEHPILKMTVKAVPSEINLPAELVNLTTKGN